MNKSVLAFILGLIMSIIGAIASYLFFAVYIIVGTFSGQIGSIFTLLPLINLASFGISCIGSILCLIKKKVGGIILIFASIISLVCYITLMISIKLYDFKIVLFMIPTIIIFLAGIIAIKKRSSQKNIK